ncbi:MAG: DUF4384 domain-containing protein [Paludibacteraceae bacterium]|nr:DUF4384 domain-containing protein [Paludibacteraceae bacterium]
MKRVLLILLCAMSLPLFAAKEKLTNVSITYDYLSNDRNESKAEAEIHAIEKAKRRALEKAFGVDVSSIVVSMDRENFEEGRLFSDEEFFSLGSTVAKGEWIETVTEKILSIYHDGDVWHVRVFVEGKAREKSGVPIDLQYAFINNSHDKQNRTTYYDNDDIFLRFTSPVSGALCVYLIDNEKTAYCLLPYMRSEKGYQDVRANRDYVFFSSDRDKEADEYVLTTQTAVEHNVLYVIFSPNKFTKARDRKGARNWRKQQVPRNLPYKDFVEWLAKVQTADKNMQVRTEVISIFQ